MFKRNLNIETISVIRLICVICGSDFVNIRRNLHIQTIRVIWLIRLICGTGRNIARHHFLKLFCPTFIRLSAPSMAHGLYSHNKEERPREKNRPERYLSLRRQRRQALFFTRFLGGFLFVVFIPLVFTP